MKRLFGGLKTKNKAKTGFTPVADMIHSGSAKISLLTHKCATGFLFVLTVDKDDSEYVTLNDSGKFTEPITHFALKFVVIGSDDLVNQTTLTYKGIAKSLLTSNDFFQEAKLQQTIWEKSILGGKPAICPPVGNFSLFENKYSKALLSVLSRLQTGLDTAHVFSFMENLLKNQPGYQIGIILMPQLNNAFEIYKVLDGNDKDLKDAAIASAGAQTIRLFLGFGTLHIDEHSGNVLVYEGKNKEMQTAVIDFGRGSNFTTIEDDEFLDVATKKQISLYRTKFLSMFHNLVSPKTRSSTPATHLTIENFIINVVLYYLEECKKVNNRLYRHNYGQIEWLSTYIQSYPPICQDIFQSLVKMMTGTHMSNDGLQIKTVNAYQSKGRLPNFNKDVGEFYYEFYDPNCGVSGCGVSGGRKTPSVLKKRKTMKRRSRTV